MAIALPSFSEPLENEEAILDAMLGALARNQLPDGTWDALHQAAVRDQRMSELANAYDSVLSGKRMKTFAPAIAAEFLYRAGLFFGDVLGDDLATVTYLERALATAPQHEAALDRLSSHFTRIRDLRRLGELYLTAAQHRPRGEQAGLLANAGAAFDAAPGAEDRAVEAYQQLARVHPDDARVRARLEALYSETGRHRDLVRMYEQALAAEPGPSPDDAVAIRERLIQIHAEELQEAERAIAHVEAVLAAKPGSVLALRVAEQLLGSRVAAARAASALASASEKSGDTESALRYLGIELEHTRGPKRAQLLKRFGLLKQDYAGDLAGAYESFEAALALDASDDELRERYCDLAVRTGKAPEAAKVLVRVSSAAREPGSKSKLIADMGYLLLEAGDPKRARAQFLSVLNLVGADVSALVRAARALANMFEAEGDKKALAGVLERLLELETDPERRRLLGERLGSLAAALGDTQRAAAAWRALVDTSSRARALAELIPLYEASERWTDLAFVLEAQAEDASGAESRALAVRAAEVLTDKGDDQDAAIEAWSRIVQKFGPSRDVFERLVPLYEAGGKWAEVANALEEDASLAPPAERSELLARVGGISVTKLKDVPRGIDAYRRALEADESDEVSRRSLERLLAEGEHQLLAARTLEPFVRARGDDLLPILRVRAKDEPHVQDRLRALDEACTLAAPTSREAALALAIDAIVLATASNEPARSFVAQVEHLCREGVDPKERAEGLSRALGERAIEDAESFALAVLLGQSLADLGQASEALAAYRRALVFEPGSADLLRRIEDILVSQGDAASRIDLYRAATERASSAEERAQLHLKIGVLHRDALADAREAARSFEAALSERPGDESAFGALCDLLAREQHWERLADVLEARLPYASPEDATALRLRLAEVAGKAGQTDRASRELRTVLAGSGLSAGAWQGVLAIADSLANEELALEAGRAVLAALGREPQDAALLGLAVRLSSRGALRSEVTAAVEGALQKAPDADAAIALYELLLGAVEGSQASDRTRWYTRLLSALQERGEEQRAFDVAKKAAEEVPEHLAFWDQLEAHARKLERPEPVADAFDSVLEHAELSAERTVELGQRAVAFVEEWLNDEARVARVLERILRADATQTWAFDRLKLIYDSSERWEELFALYDRAIAAAGADERAALLDEAAQVAKDFANHAERAIRYLEELLQLKPGNARLVAALDRLYEKTSRHRDLVALLTTQVGSLAPKEAQETRARIALLWIDKLEDAAAALLVVEDMLVREPQSAVDARPNVDCTVLLEKVLDAAPAHAEVRESIAPPATESERTRRESSPAGSLSPKRTLVRQRAAALLRDRYTDAGREEDLVRVLEVELEAVKSLKERIRRHQQIATLYVRLGNDSSAFEHYVALVLLEPEVEEHRDKLDEIAGRISRYDRLADVLVSAAEDCDDDALRVRLLMRAASVQAERLEDGRRATELYFRVLLISPLDHAAALEACRRLDPLLASAARSEERLDVLERLALLEPDPEARFAVLSNAAKLATTLGFADRAIRAWQACLEISPRDRAALDGLVQLYESTAAWPALIDVLRRRLDALDDNASQRADLVRVARIQARELSESGDAIETWRAVEERFGATDESEEALRHLYQTTRRWADLRDLLARGLKKDHDDHAKAALLCQRGDVAREFLGELGAAVADYAAALRIEPALDAARAGLMALIDTSEKKSAVDVLLEAYRKGDEKQAILALTEHRVATSDDVDAKRSVLREAMALAEEHEGDRQRAFGYAVRAFAARSEDASGADDLMRLAEATGQWRAAADAMREALESAQSDDSAWMSRVRMLLARVLDDKLDDARAALLVYLKVVDAEPKNTAAAEATMLVATRLGRWDVAAKTLVDTASSGAISEADLFALIERGATHASAWDGMTAALATVISERQLPATLARNLETRLAIWHRDRRGDPEQAEAAYTRALAHDADNRELLLELAQLQRRAKGRPLVESLLRLSGATGGDLELLREAAEVARAHVGDRALARSILDKSLKLATERWLGLDDSLSSGLPVPYEQHVQSTLGELARMFREDGDLEPLVALLLESARLPFAVQQQRQFRHDAADVLAEMGQWDRATQTYLELFSEEPSDTLAVERAGAIFERTGNVDAKLDLKRRQVAVEKDASRKVALLREAAVLEIQVGKSSSVDTLREALAIEPRNTDVVVDLAGELERQGRFSEWVDVLVDQAGRAHQEGESTAAADLWQRAAEVSAKRLEDPVRAAQCYGRVVELESRPVALDALARLAEQRGDFAAVPEHLEALRRVTQGAERADVTLRLAAALSRAGQPEAARERLEEAMRTSPNAEGVRTRLGEIYRSAEAWNELAELLTSGAEHAPNPEIKLARLREAATLHRERTGRPQSAIALLEQAAVLDPQDRSIVLELAEALGKVGRFDDARHSLRQQIETFGGRRPKERAPVHYHLAQIELLAGHRDAALAELDTATKIDPANPEILRALAEHARDDGHFERAERSYRALLAVLRRQESPSIGRSEVLVELARIAERQNEPDRAKEILESALELAQESAEEATRLERSLRRAGDSVTLTRLLEARLASSRDPAVTLALLRELAQVHEKDPSRASDALALRLRIVEAIPGDESAHTDALESAAQAGAVRTYIDHVRRLAERAREAEARVAALELDLRAAAAAFQKLEDDALATQIYEGLLGTHPTESRIWRPLCELYRSKGRTEELAGLLGRIVEAAQNPKERARLRLEQVEAVSRGSELDDAALASLEKALEEDPELIDAASLLSRAFEARGDTRRLVQVLTGLLTGARERQDRTGVVQLTLRLVDLLKQSDAHAARRTGQEALETYPDDLHLLTALASLHREAGEQAECADLLERALRLSRGEDAERIALDLHALRGELWDEPGAERALELGASMAPASQALRERLEAVYKDRGDWQKLAAFCVADAASKRANADKIQRFREAAAIYRDKLNDFASAALALTSAREADPDDLGIVGELATALRMSNNREAAEGELNSVIADALRSDEELAPLVAQRAVIREDLGQHESALADWQRAAKIRPDLFGTGLKAALERAVALAREAGQSDRARAIGLELAELLLDRGETESARAELDQMSDAWSIAPPQERAVLRLRARLEEQGEAWDSAIEAYQRLIGSERGKDLVETALRLAIVSEKAGRPELAREGLERAMREAPTHAEIRDRLLDLYERIGAGRELASLCIGQAEMTADPGERAALLVRGGAFFLSQGDAQLSLEPLKQAHALRPDIETSSYLIDAYTLSGHYAEAAALCEQVIATFKGRRSRELGAVYHRLSRTAFGLGDAAAQIKHLSTALDMDPQNGFIASELADVAMAHGQFDPATRALRMITMLKTAAPMSRAVAYQHLAVIAQQQGDPKKAVLLLKRAVTEDPALDSAKALLRQLET